MIDVWALWLLLVGLALGAAAAWLLLVRVPRQEDDVGPEERRDEAAWISGVIERDGGIAPESLVEEVLELHQAYLRDPDRAPELTVPVPAVPGPVGDEPHAASADPDASADPATSRMGVRLPPAPPPGYAPYPQAPMGARPPGSIATPTGSIAPPPGSSSAGVPPASLPSSPGVPRTDAPPPRGARAAGPPPSGR